jgi:16S rRNA processing protein RimM
MVTVGRIVRPHGNKGHVLIASETDFGEERFAVGSVLHRERDGRPEPITVEASRWHDGRWVVGFSGVTSMNDAELLRGVELRIPEDALRALGPGRYYVHDLVGCQVRTVTGQTVGTIARVDLMSGVPMLVVMDGDEEVLVPFSEAMCRRVALAERLVEIDPPEGLLDLNKRVRR